MLSILLIFFLSNYELVKKLELDSNLLSLWRMYPVHFLTSKFEVVGVAETPLPFCNVV